MRLDDHYTDPALVSRYDAENAGRADTDFYLSLAAELGPRTVVDLGCGTGVLAIDLARQSPTGRTVVSVDPAHAMLDVARSRTGGERVTWVEGTVDTVRTLLPPGTVDLLVMTGHVAQVFVTDDDWSDLLGSVAALVAPGGHLAFETRDPVARAWLGWTPERTRTQVTAADGSVSTSWVEVTAVHDEVVTFDGHTVLPDGVDRVSTSTLRFRGRSVIERDLDSAGFTVRDVYGDWDRSPVGTETSELVVVAERR